VVCCALAGIAAAKASTLAVQPRITFRTVVEAWNIAFPL
jgi:hypothetical protein